MSNLGLNKTKYSILIFFIFFQSCNLHFRGGIYKSRLFKSNFDEIQLKSKDDLQILETEVLISDSLAMIKNTNDPIISTKNQSNNTKYDIEHKKNISIKSKINVINHKKNNSIDELNKKDTSELKNYKEKVIFSVLMFSILFGLMGIAISGIIFGLINLSWIYALISAAVLGIFYLLADLFIKAVWNKRGDRTEIEKYGLMRSLNITGFILILPVAVLFYLLITRLI